jgi:hypothetical protein
VLLDIEIALSRIVLNTMQVRNRVFVIGYLVEWNFYHDKHFSEPKGSA